MFTHFTLSTKLCLTTLLTVVSLGIISFFVAAPQVSAQVTGSSASLAELQAMIQRLMAQIALLTQGGGAPVIQPPVISESIAVGTRIQTSAVVRVRGTSSVTGALVGTQTLGQAGTITAGPVSASGYRWYKVDFVTGADGWVAGNWIRVIENTATDGAALTFSLSPDNPDSSHIVAPSDKNTVLVYEIAADNSEGGDIELNTLAVGFVVNGDSFDDIVDSVNLEIDGQTFESETVLMVGGKMIATFDIDGDIYIADGEEVAVSVQVDLNEINESLSSLTIQASVADYERNLTSAEAEDVVTQFKGMAIGDVHTLISGGLIVESTEVRANTEGENNEVGDFTVEFEVIAIDQDVYIKANASQSPKGAGVSYVVDGPDEGNVTAAMSSMADEDGGYYVVSEGTTEDFEVNVWVRPTVTGQYRVSLANINYSETLGGVVKTHQVSPATDFRTPYIHIMGSGISPVEPPVTATAKIAATPSVVPAIKNGQQVVTLSWSSTDTSHCSIFEDRKGSDPIVLITNQTSAGTFKVTPTWKDGLTTTAKQYRVRCQNASTLKDSVVEATVLVKLGTVTDPVVKPTPRFNGLTYPVGTAVASVSAVFAAPVPLPAVTGPVEVGRISWGDSPTSSPVMALVTGSQMTVELKHTYKKNGTYTITLIGADKKMVTETVTVTLPVVAVAPNKNNFGCGRTLTTKFENGKIGCYGMWDYGEAFGGDVRMCGAYGVGKTGCIIKTPVCSSGTAKATAYYTGATIPAAKLTTVSANLKTSASVVTKEIAGLWEYTCIAAVVTPPVSPVPTTAPTTTTSGAVLGAATDIYSEISLTLSTIAGALSDMVAK